MFAWPSYPVGAPAAESKYAGLDGKERLTPVAKAESLRNVAVTVHSQAQVRAEDDWRIVLTQQSGLPKLGTNAGIYSGICIGDDSRFRRDFWELSERGVGWEYLQTAPQRTTSADAVDGCSSCCSGKDGQGSYFRYVSERLGGDGATSLGYAELKPFGHEGVLVSRMSKLPCTRYLGVLFDQGCGVIVPKTNRSFQQSTNTLQP